MPAFREGKMVLEGFPYSNDAKFGEDVSALLDPVLEGEEESPRTSYILMTHDGPNNSSEFLHELPSSLPVFAFACFLFSYNCDS